MTGNVALDVAFYGGVLLAAVAIFMLGWVAGASFEREDERRVAQRRAAAMAMLDRVQEARR